MKIEINLTDKEYEVLKELSQRLEISEEKILIQGLRLYQQVSNDFIKIVDKYRPELLKMWDNSHVTI